MASSLGFDVIYVKVLSFFGSHIFIAFASFSAFCGIFCHDLVTVWSRVMEAMESQLLTETDSPRYQDNSAEYKRKRVRGSVLYNTE